MNITVQQCRIRDHKVVQDRDGEQKSYGLKEFVSRLGVNWEARSIRKVFTSLQPFGYVGVMRHKKDSRKVPFYLKVSGYDGDISWLLKEDSSFSDRVEQIYLITNVDFGSKVEEPINSERVQHV